MTPFLSHLLPFSWAITHNQVPEYLVIQLLHHENPDIAVAAAQGVWYVEPERSVRPSFRADWQNVIVEKAIDQFWLSEVFQSDSQLAYEWLEARLRNTSDLYRIDYGRDAPAAINTLDIEAKRRLLHQIQNDYESVRLLTLIVNNDLDLYRELLSIERLHEFHLAPLAGNPEGIWLDKATLALGAGYTPEQVARSVHGILDVITWTGSEAAMWKDWIERFDQLRLHEDERIRQIGIAGKEISNSRMQRAQERERREAIYGRE